MMRGDANDYERHSRTAIPGGPKTNQTPPPPKKKGSVSGENHTCPVASFVMVRISLGFIDFWGQIVGAQPRMERFVLGLLCS